MRRLHALAVVFASVFGIASAACAATEARSQETGISDLKTRLDASVPALLAEKKVPSVSIARIDHRQLTLVAAYGMQSPGVPATDATLYNIASMTKPITAEVVLRLAAAQRLSLDEPMHRYWTDPDIAEDRRRMMLTPRLALSHQTGFPNWRRETDGVLRFQRAPGEAFGYSGEGFEYLARFVEKKTGEPFERLAQDLVFDPIGMRDSAYTRRPWFTGRIAVPADADGNSLSPQIADTYFASDDVYATVSDYAKFLVSLMRREDVDKAIAADRKRIQASRKNDMCPPARAAACPDDAGFGLGWEVFRFGDASYLMHTGMDDGVFALGYFNPDSGSGTVVFSSSNNGAQLILPILDAIGEDRDFVEFLRRLAQ